MEKIKSNLQTFFAVWLVTFLALGLSSFNLSGGPRFVYEPQGKEEFIFAELPKDIQDYEYLGVCKDKTVDQRKLMYQCDDNKLEYKKYVGMRGYFTGVNTYNGQSNTYLREVILETGEKYYLIFSIEYEHISRAFQPYEDYLLRKNFKPFPLIEGSSIIVREMDKDDTNMFLVGSNPARWMSQQEIKDIELIASYYPEQREKITDVLFRSDIKKDAFNNNYSITPYNYSIQQTGLSLTINLMPDRKSDVWLTASYSGEDWLFVNSFSVKTDEGIWHSEKRDFNRDYNGSIVWEWSDYKFDSDLKTLVRNIAYSKDAIIRFKGQNYTYDYVIEEQEKNHLGKLLLLIN